MFKQLLTYIKQKIYSITSKQPDFIPEEYHWPLDLISLNKLFFFLYTSINRSGYISELSHADLTLVQKGVFLTYGEILPQGLERLFLFIQPTVFDKFVDLGSGAGKAVLQSFLCTNINESYGVEIDPVRYKTSIGALSDLKQKLPLLFRDERKIEFYNCNILDFDFNKVTIVFSNATCFGPNLMGKIADKVNASESVRAIMSTHKIEGLINFSKEYLIEIETSWHIPPNKSNCYVYLRQETN